MVGPETLIKIHGLSVKLVTVLAGLFILHLSPCNLIQMLSMEWNVPVSFLGLQSDEFPQAP